MISHNMIQMFILIRLRFKFHVLRGRKKRFNYEFHLTEIVKLVPLFQFIRNRSSYFMKAKNFV